MDPAANLKRIRELLKEIDGMHSDDEWFYVRVTDLIDYVEALDEWMSKGGFIPAQWMAAR